MGKRLTFSQRIGQAGIVAGGLATVFTGAVGRLPPSILAFAALAGVAITAFIWIRLRGERDEDEHISPSTCAVAIVLLSLMALFGFGQLSGAQQTTIAAQQVRSQVDTIVASATFQAPQAPAAISSRVVANSPQANEFANAVRRALSTRASSVRSPGGEAQHVDIAVTADGEYSNLAALEFRGRVAANLRVRETGLVCTVSLSRDGRIEAVARDVSNDLIERAELMLRGEQEC